MTELGQRLGRGAGGPPRRAGGADPGAGPHADAQPAGRELPRDLRADRRAAGAAAASRSSFVRGEGAPGDSDRHPRWNLVARREGARPGPCVHFNGHTDVVEVGQGWTHRPVRGRAARRPDLRPRRLRHEGRARGGDRRGRGLPRRSARTFPARSRSRRPPTRRPAATAASRILAGLGHFARVDHVIIPEPLNKDRVCLGHRGVWWAELETHGRIAHGSMPFLGDCAVRHMGAVLAEMEASLWPALAARRTAMPVVPPAARASTLNINSLHGGQAEPQAGFTGWPSPVVPDRCRMVIDRRFLAEEEIGAVKAEFRATVERARAGRGFAYAIRDMHEVLPTMTDRDAPVAAALARAVGRVLGRRGGIRGLARHLRPEAHRPDRAAAELRRLRAGHTGPGASTRRICRASRTCSTPPW